MTVPEPKLIRVCDLQKGDVYSQFGTKKYVAKIDEKYIHYAYISNRSYWSKMGKNSQEKVILLTKPAKSKPRYDKSYSATPHSKKKDYSPQAALVPKSNQKVSWDIRNESLKSNR